MVYAERDNIHFLKRFLKISMEVSSSVLLFV